jgi:hypothetical protein
MVFETEISLLTHKNKLPHWQKLPNAVLKLFVHGAELCITVLLIFP